MAFKYIVQILVSSASLMLELSPFDLVLTLMLMCIFIMFLFFLSFLCCQIGFARKTAEGEYLNLHLNIKEFYFSRTS